MIIGFDISTSITGVAIVSGGQLVHYGSIDLRKYKDVFDKKAKQVVLLHLLENESSFKIEYTRYGNPKPESYDHADAIVIAKAGWEVENLQKSIDNE